jgi:hypothetical protein
VFEIIKLVAIGLALAAMAAAAHKAWTSFKEGIAAPYVQAQIAADQPKIDAAVAAQTLAEANTKAARDSEASCKSASEVVTAQAKKDKDKSAALEQQLVATKHANAAAATASQPEIDRWRAAARDEKNAHKVCEDTLAVITPELRDQAKQQIRQRGGK